MSAWNSKTIKEKIFISEQDQFLFGEGKHYEIYKKLGAHPSVEKGVKGIYFAVWAPNAESVYVAGDFNEWDNSQYQLIKLGEIGIFALFIPGILENEIYKFIIITPDGRSFLKADPFANFAEYRPGTASKITDLTKFKWTDDSWIKSRTNKDMNKEPLAVYECHIGSWMRHPGRIDEGFYNYSEFAIRIVEYLKEMKYTHIELMGIAEYPFDGSWGYQVTGYFAPTARYGTPEDFMYLINTLHKNGIGVILDWVPAHFPKDAFALAEFDGTCLFEHPDKRLGEHPEWGTKIFNFGKNEISNFLIANALFWIKEYHIDGLRVDAVASMLYLNYGKEDGEWVANIHGGVENLEAIAFLKHLNTIVAKTCKGVMMIAEESTSWPKVTGKIEDGGLGFTFKWNMGWMHDFCKYMQLDPLFKKDHHHQMTFAMSYNESENYIMPLSHDEVVHMKGSMVNKMPGDEADKYANLRVGYTYMFGHEGKKLLFMGQDFGQEREWSEARELDWLLLEKPLNKGMKNYVSKLLTIYQKYPCLYQIDNNWAGFEWMDADNEEKSIYAFVRRGIQTKKNLLFVLNMTPVERQNHRIPVPKRGLYKLILNSDEIEFGGKGAIKNSNYIGENIPLEQQDYSISFQLSGYSAAIFEF